MESEQRKNAIRGGVSSDRIEQFLRRHDYLFDLLRQGGLPHGVGDEPAGVRGLPVQDAVRHPGGFRGHDAGSSRRYGHPDHARLPDAAESRRDVSGLLAGHDGSGKGKGRKAAPDERKVPAGDVGALPFADGQFDLVLSLNGFHAFPDKEAAYRETFRVLKPGGTFCGCFYVSGEHKRTDWMIRHVYEPTKFFTPPYETVDQPAEAFAGHVRAGGRRQLEEHCVVYLPQGGLIGTGDAGRMRETSSKVTLSGVPETMLQTVYARAKETQNRGAVRDEKAVEIIRRLDYDFSLADKDSAMSSGVIARTIVLDKLVKTYLSAHPGAVAVNIACGLDTRCYRMQGYQHWYNLDLPETIAVREKLLPENGKISQIAMSAMDDWGGMIRESGDALVIIEGLTMYLSEADVQRIFDVIARRFPRVTVLVEVMNPLVVRNFKEKSIEGSHAKFTWGVRSGQALAALLPGFQLVEEHSLTEGMAEFLPIYKVLGKIPLVRNISNRIVVLQK